MSPQKQNSQKRDFFDFDHNIYRPLWVRVLIFLICIGWGGFELSAGSVFWGILFLSLGAYCFWGFFIRQKGQE